MIVESTLSTYPLGMVEHGHRESPHLHSQTLQSISIKTLDGPNASGAQVVQARLACNSTRTTPPSLPTKRSKRPATRKPRRRTAPAPRMPLPPREVD